MAGDRKLELLPSHAGSKIKARDLDTGEVILISAGDVDFEIDRRESDFQSASKIARSSRSIEGLDQSEIELAALRYETLLPLVGKSLSKEDVSQAAERLSISTSQIYRLIPKLDVELGFLSLVPQKRGRLKGENGIAGDAEDVIHEMIKLHYKGVGATFQKVITKVQDRCRELGLSVPSDSTICNRIKSKGEKQLLKQTDGAKAASQKYDVRGGKLALSAPLELIQIDHALVDCIIVDSNQRLPIGRPWATLAIDVFSRSVIGIHLSLAHPSAMSVALCISHAILPKDWWLRKYGLESTQFPFYGVPQRIHVDNAREFRSDKLKASCRLYEIKLTYRPRGVPHNGAHIERLIGTLMKRTHMLPGTTMSTVKERGDYKSEKHAALTFSEFREWFIREVEIYHSKKHSDLGCSPLLQWEKYFSDSDRKFSHPPVVENRRKLLLNFMPSLRRRIGRQGIRLNTIDYYSNSMKRLEIGTRCLVRYDPESISKVWILPEGEEDYIELGYADVRRPDTSLSEYRYARKVLALQSQGRVSSDQVFALIKKNEQLVEGAVRSTKAMRKTQERKKTRQSDQGHILNEGQLQPRPTITKSVDYSRRPMPFQVEE